MAMPSRSQSAWPAWLTWGAPAGLGLLVIIYEVVYQATVEHARPLVIFYLEIVVFGLLGPWAIWRLARQLVRFDAAGQAAAVQIAALRAHEHYLAAFIASSADAIVGLDPHGQIAVWNRGAETLFGYRAHEALGRSASALFVPPGEPRATWEQITTSEIAHNCELVVCTRAGRELPVEITFIPPRAVAGLWPGGIATLHASRRFPALAAEDQRRGQELTALYAVSAAMNQAPSLKEALTQALNRGLAVLHLDSGRIYLLDGQTGHLSLAAAQGDPPRLDPHDPAITSGACLCGLAAPGGDTLQVSELGHDLRVTREACRRHNGQACAAVPLLAKERMLGILHVTSQRPAAFDAAEMALLRSIGAQIGVAVENMRLREEARRAEALSTLIQEMHHRIKNNLQTVADLLSLEISASRSAEARKSLHDSISRIKSIAAVHQLLSLEQLRLTDITELARQVCDISLRHLVRPGQQVNVEINGPAIYLPSKQATALALVMNELVSNALEHAFSADTLDGRLTVTLAQDGPRVTVSVADNGRGLPADFDLDANRGLGLQIVRTLVEKDLAGTLRLMPESEGGSRVTLTFFR